VADRGAFGDDPFGRFAVAKLTKEIHALLLQRGTAA
jgi:hypothetical protein